MKSYTGSCHGGAVRSGVETDLADPVRFNCSFWRRRSALLQKVPADRFSLTNGDDSLSRCGSRDFSDHFFCRRGGIHTFTRSTRNGENVVLVNLACLDGLDLDASEPRLFDGATLL